MAAPVDAKLLKKTKFPPEFNRKVDMKKVNIEVMKKWIASRISEILGNEDDVVIELCFNLIEGTRFPDIKSLQIQLTGFLDRDTAKFCQELWSLCLSGQDNPQGVPKELLEAKKLELMQEKAEAEKAAEAARRSREQEQNRDREMDDLRRRERADRGGPSGRGRRGGGRDFPKVGRRSSRSPPRYRSRERFREPPSRRDFDSYVPSGSHRGRRPTRTPNSRSPSRSRSRSRSPPRRQRRRSPSRSKSPDRRDRYEKRRRSPNYGDRDRSITRSDSSRSRTPRRDRDRRRPVSRSVTPPRHHNRHIGPSNSRRYSKSPERSRERVGKQYKKNDAGRLGRSRSGSREHHSQHHSPGPKNDRGRRRSLERYNPASRRRRNSSSVSAPNEKRQKMANDDEVPTRRSRSPVEKPSTEPKEKDDADETKSELGPSRNHSNELRGKLLREKLVAMHRSSTDKVP